MVLTLISRTAHLQIGSDAFYIINLKKLPGKLLLVGYATICHCYWDHSHHSLLPLALRTFTKQIQGCLLVMTDPVLIPTFLRSMFASILYGNFHIVLLKYLTETTSGGRVYYGSKFQKVHCHLTPCFWATIRQKGIAVDACGRYIKTDRKQKEKLA